MTLEEQASNLSHQEIVSVLVVNNTLSEQNNKLSQQNTDLKQQLDWFKKQLFGQKSEKREYIEDRRQLFLGELGKVETNPEPVKTKVTSYERGKAKKIPLDNAVSESGLRFGPEVPVEVINVPNPEIEGLSEDEYEVVSEKVSHKLAQQPGSYVVLKYVRKTIKKKERQEPLTPAAPAAVIEKSFADVSFLVGMLVDKFLYHLPLFRQHQRLKDSGIVISRGTLTHLVHRTIELLTPIYLAQYTSILESATICMDEIPMKASRKIKGKMNTSYYWPIYGDKDEICFPWCDSRAHGHVSRLLQGFSGILLSDGYDAYANYAKSENNIIQAGCWNHSRRNFVDALEVEPGLVGKALDFIAEFYKNENTIREEGLTEDKKLAYRVIHTKPLVEKFFAWLEEVLVAHTLLPSSPFTKAANYVFKREEQLKVFLRFPDVQIDTNHEERELRSIAMGRKNWNFCWTEIGAQYVGIVQSLIRTCLLHQINPYDYLVDVLQRIDSHPQSNIQLLTPRLWKEHFLESRLKTPLQVNREKTRQDTS